MEPQKRKDATCMECFARKNSPPADGFPNRPSWRTFKMFPRDATAGPVPLLTPVGLADDFATWYESWTWTWAKTWSKEAKEAKGGKTYIVEQVGEPQVVVSEGNPKQSTVPAPPAPPAPSVSLLNPRQAFIASISIAPKLSPSSSSSSSSSSNHAHSPTSFSSPSSSPPTTQIISSDTTNQPTSPPLFSTNFFEARKSKKGGFGAFATIDIEEGTVIMTEEPLFKASFVEVFAELEKLTPQQREQYRTLYGFKEMSPVRDLAIYKTNRFATPEGRGGIFLRSSRFNHACHPYATCKYSLNKTTGNLVVTACIPIKKGDEVTISYTNSPSQLPDNYGFYCDCPGCLSPKEATKRAKFLRGPAQ